MTLDAVKPIKIEVDPDLFTKPILAVEYFDASASSKISRPIDSYLTSEIKFRVNSFRNLNINWDGYEGIAPSENTVQTCFSFFNKLPKIYYKNLISDDISLTPYGTITIDWEDKGRLVSVEIGNNSIGFFSNFWGDESLIIENSQFNSKKDIPNDLVTAIKKFHS